MLDILRNSNVYKQWHCPLGYHYRQSKIKTCDMLSLFVFHASDKTHPPKSKDSEGIRNPWLETILLI